jgi:hypothetical protein
MKRYAAVVATVSLTLAAPTAALAEYRGTDIWGNIAPTDHAVGLADKYPLSFYGLDYHVDGPSVGLGGIGTGDVPAMIAQFIASLLFQITVWLTNVVLDIFDWAFSVDLINGPSGALIPIGNATQNLYANTLGPTFLVAAILILGMWAMHKALVQRRFPDATSGLAVSVLLVVIAMLLILKPEATIGRFSEMTNTLSDALLAGATGDSTGARTHAEDHLFQTFVYNPWVALEFGGLTHCVGAARDKDGFPKPVPPNTAGATCIDHVHAHNGVGGYAPRFLENPPGSDERDQMYEALKNGESNPTWPGWRITKADAPGVDIQQAGGAFQRLALAVLIFAGTLGAVLLLGMLAFAALLAQVIALALLAFAPAALLAGVIPGWGHKLFRGWLSKLGIALFIKAVYSLILAILIGVSLALDAAAGAVSYLFAFGLQAAFFWMVFLKRKALAGIMLTHRETTKVERTTREAIAAPVATAAGVGWAGGVAAARRARSHGEESEEQQEHAPRPGRPGHVVTPADEIVATTSPAASGAGAAEGHVYRSREAEPVLVEVERVPAKPAEPARGGRTELATALEDAQPVEPAPTQRPVADVIGPARQPAPPPERAERPGDQRVIARPDPERAQPERITRPPGDE